MTFDERARDIVESIASNPCPSDGDDDCVFCGIVVPSRDVPDSKLEFHAIDCAYRMSVQWDRDFRKQRLIDHNLVRTGLLKAIADGGPFVEEYRENLAKLDAQWEEECKP